MNFEYLSPVHIIFGNGRIKELGKIAEKHGDRAFVVCGRTAMRKHGCLERILGLLKDEGIGCFVFDRVSPNPRSDEVDEAIQEIRAREYNLIIGLGGGSALDSAKAISVGINYDSIREVIGGESLEADMKSLPVITIPTTSGSGAEVTKGAIITDTKRGLKSGVRGSALFPKVAIVDPELTYTMSRDLTATTGFDALTHAIDTYVANHASPLTELLSEEAMGSIYEYLPRAIENGEDREAREKMALASLMGGINIVNASTCLPHRLQQAMGSVIDIPHGVGMATLYPAWLKRVSVYRKEKFDRISEILGSGRRGGDEAVIEFMKRVGVYYNLGSFARREEIGRFLDKVSGNVENDPIPNIDRKTMREIYEESFR